jgi:hypothetical protein
LRRPLEAEGLLRTLEDLAALGDKRAGSPGGQRAAAYLCDRFRALGLAPAVDPFHFPAHQVTAATLELMGRPVACEVLEASGAARLRARVLDVGRAQAPLARRLDGAVALVERDTLLHRSAQYQAVQAAGGSAMLVASAAPANLLQVGSVRRAWEAAGPIAALTLGARDARQLAPALAAGAPVEAALEVDVQVAPAVGQNLVARIAGERPEQIVVGAHYDTWFAGSTDNGAGVAAVVDLARRWRTRARPRLTLVFVAWDGEELALYGGYDFLRRHVVVGREPVLAVIDLETPASLGAQAYALAHSSQAVWERVLDATGVLDLFAAAAPMALVPELFGGVIPTDIQGLYRAGTPVLSTAGDGPYYHTAEDTPDKVDLHRLAQLVEAFDRMIVRLVAEEPHAFAGRDHGLWRIDVERAEPPAMAVTVRDGSLVPQPRAQVEAVLVGDHFFEAASRRGCTDDHGRFRCAFPEAAGARPPRFVHVTAGARHPLAELIVPLD